MVESARWQRIPQAVHFDRLLGLCARGDEPPEMHVELRRVAAGYAAWERLSADAEWHGIAPLVHRHLRAAQVELAPDVSRSLAALALRHRKTNALRQGMLAELVAAFAARDVPLLLLKGAALAFHLYAEPGLRPMRDFDVLVRPEDLPQVDEILSALGYHAEHPTTWLTETEHHHQRERHRVVDGLRFTIEVHRRLGILRPGARRTLDELWDASESFTLDGVTARTLGPNDMLVHVYHHGFCTSLHWPDRCRLVSVADVVTLVETQGERLDWDVLRREHTRMWQALAWVDLATPWSAAARARAGWPPTAALEDVGRDYTGLRRERTSERPDDRIQHLRETFAPPTFWLRLRHGGSPGTLGYLGDWLRHVYELL